MKLILMKIIKYLLVPFGMLYSFLKRDKKEIMILMYHRINDEVKKELAVTKNNFFWQIDYLKRKNHKIISMDEAYEKIKVNNIDDRYIVLTFDDGYEDFYYNAYPRLKKNNLPAILYLVPGFIDTDKIFWWDKDLGKSDLMDWSQINELIKSNIIDIGSHTLSHYDVDGLNTEEIRYELEKSMGILENMTGKRVKHFSYPRGIYSQAGGEVVKELYDTGVLIFNGKEINSAFNMDDLTRLKRIPVQNSDGKYLFVARINGWLILEEIIRRLIGK